MLCGVIIVGWGAVVFGGCSFWFGFVCYVYLGVVFRGYFCNFVVFVCSFILGSVFPQPEVFFCCIIIISEERVSGFGW